MKLDVFLAIGGKMADIIKKVRNKGLCCSVRTLIFKVAPNRFKKILVKLWCKIKPCFQKVFIWTDHIKINKLLNHAPRKLYAFYDLQVSPVTYDIVKYLLLVAMKKNELRCDSVNIVIVPGPDEGFCNGELKSYKVARAKNYNYKTLWWRFRNILIPSLWHLPCPAEVTLCASREDAYRIKANAEHVFPEDYTVSAPTSRHDWKYIRKAHLRGGRLLGLVATAQAKEYVSEWIKKNVGDRKIVVITLRESEWHHDRNSNLIAWSSFAKGLDDKEYFPVILRDTEASFKPVPKELEGLLFFDEAAWNMELRMALYEIAYLNMFTNGGPASLCRSNFKTRYLVFKMVAGSDLPPKFFLERWGLAPGEQFEFQTPFQKLIWEDDEIETIKKAFGDMVQEIERNEIENQFEKEAVTSDRLHGANGIISDVASEVS